MRAEAPTNKSLASEAHGDRSRFCQQRDAREQHFQGLKILCGGWWKHVLGCRGAEGNERGGYAAV
jgi:hypothetical protein